MPGSKLRFRSCSLLFAAVFAGNVALADDTAVVKWDAAALQAVRVTHPGPPVVARDLAIVHTAIYDSWTAYSDRAVGTRLGGSLRRPEMEHTEANIAEAISFAAYRALVDLFPSQIASFDALMSSMNYDPLDTTTDVMTPAGIGNVAAAAVIEFRHQDGANQLGDLNPGPYSDYTGYAPVNSPDIINDANRWQPLRVSDGHGGFIVQKFITPQWFKVTPFALKSADQFRSKPPSLYAQDVKSYVRQAQQVLTYSAGLTDKQKVIAEYWADGPSSELPPGHWALFAQAVSRRDHHDNDEDARMFFAMTNAIFDASIVAWDAKRYYDYVRPVTAIHALFAGQPVLAWAGPYEGTQLIDGKDWKPYQASTVVTPPFPEYISGHSIFSAAGATVLERFTGSERFGGSVVIPQGSSRVEPDRVPANDMTLYWPTFRDAADEAGMSRRYGGIHFIMGDLQARKAGKRVGEQAWRKAKAYFKGDQGKHDNKQEG